ncbi:hypothetical protein GCM10009745_53920 [Kribbella yunnanensis]|uniref:Uncharacterized protein n=1 Tax=Kribbella yunnanensis TaxID=190194 RepID=A0ABP4UB67_9ACTN
MDLGGLDLGELMDDVSKAGVTIMLKIDHERLHAGGKPWTAVLSGPPVGGSGVIRWDTWTLEECLVAVLERLRIRYPEWEWLDLYR